MLRIALFVLIAAFSLARERLAFSQGYPPAEAAARMTVPDDLQLTLVVAEPMVRQPVCIEVDDRGRLWVIQYLQYPNPAGLERAKVDRFSRTTYDRVPEPPPHGPSGADRITILEDTDGDGVADESHDFVDGLNLATGLAFGYGGVFVMQVPYLLFYPDKNQDDVPDGEPEVLVKGFGMDDAHSVANSLTWGPDGWLYGCQGSTVTARIDGVEFQQGVWRYHPLKKKFELFCEGGGNSWGLDFDRHGRLLYGTNHGGYRMLHAVPGAYYWKSFGKHGPLHNPFAYGYFDHVPHTDFKGGHVTVGGIVYQGDGLPEKYRDKYLFADTLGHQLFWDRIEPRGSTVKSAYGGELVVGNDTWFAPCDVTTGPDGSVYFCDWHDARMAHPDPDAEWDRRNGRIYRLSSSGPLAPTAEARVSGRGRAWPDDPSSLTTAELIKLHAHPNNWIVRRARRILTERRDPAALEPLQTLALTSDNDQLALECFWTFASCSGLTDETAPQFLTHRHPQIRRWTTQFLGDEPKLSESTTKLLQTLAAEEKDVEVLTLLACTARRLPAKAMSGIVLPLLSRSDVPDDSYLPLLIWWAIERHSVTSRKVVMSMMQNPWVQGSRIARSDILPRLIRRYAAENTVAGLECCGTLMPMVYFYDQQAAFSAFDQGLSERAESLRLTWSDAPQRLQSFLGHYGPEKLTNPTLLRAGLRFHQRQAAERALELATSAEVTSEQRLPYIKILAEVGDESVVGPLLAILINERESESARLAALAGLQRFQDDRIRDALLQLYLTSGPAFQPRISQALLSRPEWAAAYLRKFLSQDFPVKNLKAEDWQNVIAELSEEDRDLVVKIWGSVAPSTPEERLAEIRRLNNDLRASAGDPRNGKQLFGQHCAICHKLHNEGFNVGPDLTHANRKDRDYLLLQMVDPNAIIRKEFLAYSVATNDGRVLTGLLVNQNAAELTLMAAKEQKSTVPLADVEELKESKASLMPENVLKQLKPQELRDLFAFLQQP